LVSGGGGGGTFACGRGGWGCPNSDEVTDTSVTLGVYDMYFVAIT
jgi:hypothetical protein